MCISVCEGMHAMCVCKKFKFVVILYVNNEKLEALSTDTDLVTIFLR